MPQLFDKRCTTKYYRILKELFFEVDFMEGKFLKDFRSALQEYASTDQGCTYEMLVNKFGAPEEVWYDYVSAQDADYLLSCVNKKHIKKWGVRCVVILCICCLLIYVMFSYSVYNKANVSIVDEKETVIDIIEEDEK